MRKSNEVSKVEEYGCLIVDLLPIVDGVEGENFGDVFTRFLHENFACLLEHLKRAKIENMGRG